MSIAKNSSIVVITAARHYVRFFDFDISDDYLDNLEANSPEATHFLHVNATEWFDLRERSGRASFVQNFFGILAWKKALLELD